MPDRTKVTPIRGGAGPRRRPATVAQAVERGERAVLVALRRVVAEALDRKPGPRETVALSHRLMQINDQIGMLDAMAAEAAAAAGGAQDEEAGQETDTAFRVEDL
jgi:hypothetical protein